MKTFKRTSLPESITYNGEIYTQNARISGSMIASCTKPEKVIEALRTTGRKGVVVEVLSSRLKGKTDWHGKPYRPSQFIFTNETK